MVELGVICRAMWIDGKEGVGLAFLLIVRQREVLRIYLCVEMAKSVSSHDVICIVVCRFGHT